jgi:hypothetical protein
VVCGILKLKKFKKIPKLIENVKTSKVLCHTYIEYNVHDVLRKVAVYYTKKHKNI